MNRLKQAKKELKQLDLSKREKISMMYALLEDLGSEWIRVDNLAKILDISVSKARKCKFRAFDREKQRTILPEFIKEPSFEEIWMNHNHSEDPRQLLDLLSRVNVWVKTIDHSAFVDPSRVLSKFYSAKSWILYELRDHVVEVGEQRTSTGQRLLTFLLDTEHRYHLPLNNSRDKKYWESRIEGEPGDFEKPEYEIRPEEDPEFYLRAVDLLFYISRRGVDTEKGAD